ncbi:MAG: D-glycero-beta-D-manno-heptose 1-phosphate adenylyltransferase [bacterium]
MRDKILSKEGARRLRKLAAEQGRTVVFTNGCFDVLHAGHVDYLEAARTEGDLLIVGMNSDSSTFRIKGPDRPVVCEDDRAAVLSGLAAVDAVVVFEEDDPLALIKELQPDVLVKGSDWPEDRIIGAAEVKSRGGRVARIEMTPGRSSSGIIERIRQSSGREGERE